MLVQTSVSVIPMSYHPRGYPSDLLWEELDTAHRRSPRLDRLLASNRQIGHRHHRRQNHGLPYERVAWFVKREYGGVPWEKRMVPGVWKSLIYSKPMASGLLERVFSATKGRICIHRFSFSSLASLQVLCETQRPLSIIDAVRQIPLTCRMMELRAAHFRP